MSILTQAQATRAARITGTPTTDQISTLTDMIAALNGALEPEAGPIESEPRTYKIWTYGMRTLRLPWRFQSISSIVCDGQTIDPTRYDASTQAESGIILPVALNVSPWSVAYVTVVTAIVGYATVPANLIYAAELLIQSWWQTAAMGRGPASEALQWAPPKAELPPSVLQAIGVQNAMPGFA